MKRKLDELNLLDNFLFGKMVTDPENGEKFSRKLLKVIFQRNFGNLTVVPQKVYYGSDTDLHGTRLDVYLEEEDAASVYDVEPDRKESEKDSLPRRVRFYHAKIDAQSLKSGEGYDTLKNVVIIMILPFDPFGEDWMRYTIRNMCEEHPDMSYDDGARTIFLYTKGKGGPRELEEFLNYIENTTEANAVNEDLADIQQMVRKVKQSEEVSLEYMRLMEDEKWLKEQGRKEERANTERERQRAEAAEQRADTAEQRADTAEQRADTAEQRADTAEQRADTAEQRADTAEQRADTAEQRADTAEAEVKKLKEELERLKSKKQL